MNRIIASCLLGGCVLLHSPVYAATPTNKKHTNICTHVGRLIKKPYSAARQRWNTLEPSTRGAITGFCAGIGTSVALLLLLHKQIGAIVCTQINHAQEKEIVRLNTLLSKANVQYEILDKNFSTIKTTLENIFGPAENTNSNQTPASANYHFDNEILDSFPLVTTSRTTDEQKDRLIELDNLLN